MEDCESVISNESIATSDEFDFISDKPGASKTPTLNITNGKTISELKYSLSEAMQEADINSEETLSQEPKQIGQSLFYTQPAASEMDPLSVGVDKILTSPTEKQDIMKPDFSDEEGKI